MTLAESAISSRLPLYIPFLLLCFSLRIDLDSDPFELAALVIHWHEIEEVRSGPRRAQKLQNWSSKP